MPIVKVQIVDGVGNASGGSSATPSFVQLSDGTVVCKTATVVPTATLTGFLNSLPWAVFHTTPTTRTDGQGGPVEADSAGNTLASLGTRIAGEDVVNDVLKVEGRFTFLNITSATTTTVKSGAGVLHAIVMNTPAASATITIWDNTTNSGTKIGTITLPGSLLSDGPISVDYDVAFATGLAITTTGTTELTVSYR